MNNKQLANNKEEPNSQNEGAKNHQASFIKDNGFLRRCIVTVFSLLILAIGVSFSIKSNLGVSPVNSLPFVLSRVLSWDMGIVTALLFTFFCLMQLVLLRRDYKIYSLFQVLMGILFGSFVSLTNRLLAFDDPAIYIVRLCFMAISIFLIALGLTLIIGANVIPMPPEGLMLAIQKKTGYKFHRIKTAFDSTTVALALIISFIGLGKIEGIREGTLISAIMVGIVMGYIKKAFKSQINALLSVKEKEEENPAPEKPGA